MHVKYDGGSYATILFDDQWLLKDTGSNKALISGYMSRKTPLQGSAVHEFKFIATAHGSNFYIYANTMHWEVYEIYKP